MLKKKTFINTNKSASTEGESVSVEDKPTAEKKKSFRDRLKLKRPDAEKDVLQPLDIEGDIEGDIEEDIEGGVEENEPEELEQTSDENDILSDQLEDLRGELKSQLPEPEEFLSFEKVIADREGEDDADSPGRFPNSPRFLIRFGIIMTAIAIVIVSGLVLFLRVEVPNVAGLTAVEASEILVDLGLNFEIFEEEVAGIPAGQVISSTPAVGDYALWGTTVVIRVAVDGDYSAVPSNLRGMSLEDAKAALTELRLNSEVVYTFDNTQPQGSVVGFLPIRDTQLPAGSSVTLLVSAGALETPIEVPDVRNLTEDAARRVIEGVGLNPVFYYAATTHGRINHVAAQVPGVDNAVSPGSSVLIMISMGNSTTDHPVPELGGLAEQSAITMVEQSGFAPESFRMINELVAAGTVISQMPPADYALLRSGERMGFLVSVGNQTEAEVPNVLGLGSEEADTAIREAGFNPIIVASPELQAQGEAGEHFGIAVQQFPQGNVQYHIGLPVLIYLSVQD